jgi:hypothetical protein
VNLKIDPEFRDICRKLADDEFAILQDDVIDNGCRDAIVIWDGIIVDGHNRYKICKQHDISFETVKMSFNDRDDARLWIINNQLGRRNLSPVDRVALVELKRPLLEARAKERQIASGGDKRAVVKNFTQPLNNAEKGKTRDKLASEAGVSGPTYDRLKKVNERGVEELKQAVRERKVSASRAAEIAELPKEEQVEIITHGDPVDPPVVIKPTKEALDESEKLVGLKRYWRESTKKDKKIFIKWIVSRNEISKGDLK